MFAIYMLMRLTVYEEIGGHGEADGDDDPADVLRVYFLRVVGAAVAADEAADEHQNGLRPDDDSGDDKSGHGDAVDDADEENFYAVHCVNIFHAEQGEEGEDEDADTGAEIADVHGDEEFEKDSGDEKWAGSLALRGTLLDPGADPGAGEEQQCGGEQEPGDEAHEC